MTQDVGSDGLGKLIITIGVILVIVGATILLSGKIQFISKLPGDILIKKGNFTFYLPITTSIVVSIILSVIFAIFAYLRK